MNALLLPLLVVIIPAARPPEDAKAFVARVNAELRDLTIQQTTAEWVHQTFITEDTDRISSSFNEQLLGYVVRATQESIRFDTQKLDFSTARSLKLLRLTPEMPAPLDPVKRRKLTDISTQLASMYGKGRACGKDGKCRDLLQLEEVLDKSHNYQELLEAWVGWHGVGRPMRPLYEQLVSLSNQGARDIGFADLGEMWRGGYDMEPQAFSSETDRLFDEVKPFYEQLHCYVRSRLSAVYGKQKVPDTGPIPAHLLGNMWAQEWGNIYPLVEPYPGQSNIDVNGALVKKGYDSVKLVKLAESFFTSLGLDPLPATFWQRSLFKKPADREVICHASAWDVQLDNDLRLKACLRVNDQDLVTAHHELGHLYYFHAYDKLPVLFQRGANDGFHEAIGDAVALSITPGYLQKVGLLDKVPQSDKALLNVQMKEALDKVAFLPFGKLIDQWRWDVFAGKVKPADYNAAWWALRLKYQGVAPPLTRSEADFDPGAKYHVASATPYMRYFLARILQFQFHQALCKAAGSGDSLHACSIAGSKEAGRRLQSMLAMGATRPWPDALEALTGERKMSSAALLEYFAPLRGWLAQQNQGKRCGWAPSMPPRPAGG